MPAKRGLITDTFKVVKRARTRDQKPPSPPESEPEIPVISERERDLQELKTFDLDWHFGPCIGISRLQRWERAALHGLDPPREIKELLQSNEDDPEYTQCLWRDYPL
ncbi:DNA polymerase delta subunit 4 [Denticeps clupeoides]|nr:DNA polymerase delta subunit 4 [Denticeps clupeoides]XP_028833807.1 DNA polymerase delta subunit 4 [Denticeps clupeoides]XP_028833808.1 DNA polymerase delta subunit 4 [Denticeps clupeoides]XP_028833809.1 DNA polymerase delta subunit 4 [Denticeps clupeoides]